MTSNDDLNRLGYVSSAPDFSSSDIDEPKAQDQVDLPALEAVLKVLKARKAHYKTTDSLQLGDLSLDNQLIINKQMQFHIQELESLLTSTITKVKEKLNVQQ